MISNVKDFCLNTGYPVAMIRRLCRQGELPHLRNGRMILIDSEVVERILQKRATEHAHIKSWNNSGKSWQEELKELQKEKSPKAVAAALGRAN